MMAPKTVPQLSHPMQDGKALNLIAAFCSFQIEFQARRSLVLSSHSAEAFWEAKYIFSSEDEDFIGEQPMFAMHHNLAAVVGGW